MGFLCCQYISTSNFTPNIQMSLSILENAQIVAQQRVKEWQWISNVQCPVDKGITHQAFDDPIDSVPQAVHGACYHGDAQTNKPTKRDGRVGPLICPLHNADKASAAPPIGWNFMTTF